MYRTKKIAKDTAMLYNFVQRFFIKLTRDSKCVDIERIAVYYGILLLLFGSPLDAC